MAATKKLTTSAKRSDRRAGAASSQRPFVPSRGAKPRSFEEWRALRRWSQLPPGEPLRPGYLLREAREAAGLTQADLAARLGISQQAVAQTERPNANPTVGLLASWSRALGVELRVDLGTPGRSRLGAS